MKTEKMYIGVRDTDFGQERQADYLLTNLPVLNERLSKSVRQGAMVKGIVQTIKGKKIKIYVGDQKVINTLKTLTDNVVLFSVSDEELTNGLQEHNSKFPSRMDKETHKRYESGLKEVFSNIVQVVHNDKDDHKVKVKDNQTIKVGDWIKTPQKFRYMNGGIISEMCRVYRVSKSSYWVELPFMTEYPKGVACGKFARRNYEGVNGLINETDYQADEDWTIPYEENKDVMDFQQMKNPLRLPKVDEYFYVENQPNKQGYNHSYSYN